MRSRRHRIRNWRWLGASVVAAGAVGLSATVAPPAVAKATVAASSQALTQCALPAAGTSPAAASPAAEGFNPAKLAAAMTFAETRLRTSVQVFRDNCLVASDPVNTLTGDLPWNIWSSTKSVVSMLAGIAVTQGKLSVDAPIRRYLPAGLGDAAHRAITVRDLLTQASGLQQAAVSELAPGAPAADTNLVDQALAVPVQYKPGTYFQYSQYTPDLLAYVIQRAVGEDLQAYAQRYLFGPVGIKPGDYFWLRDRSGNTYGFANLYLPPDDFARLGLLMENDGAWNGRQVIAPGYVAAAHQPSATNACYGYLFWLNRAPCTGPSLPSRQTFDVTPLAGLTSQAYAMVGFLQQNNFIDPSLHLVVTWTGTFGDASLDPQTLISASPNSELYHDFLRLLNQAFTSPRLPDPGPYKPTFNLDVAPEQFADPSIALGAIGVGPDAPKGCNLLYCDGAIPVTGTIQNAQGITRAVTSRLP